MVDQAIIDDIERNRRQRLEFITWYARWVKATPNEVWSKQQKELIESVLRSSDRIRQEGVKVRSSMD